MKMSRRLRRSSVVFQCRYALRRVRQLPVGVNLRARVSSSRKEGLIDRSPTPQGLRCDRWGWACRIQGFGCAVVCEGDLAV